MKTHFRLGAVVLSGLLVLSGAGCHRQNAALVQHPATLPDAVANLQQLLATASPAVTSNFYGGVTYNIRYRKYDQASQSLAAIASDPSLNDQQKQAVSDLSDQLKQAMAGNAAPSVH